MHAFPKSVRLRHTLEIRGTLDQGLKAVGPLLVLFLKPRTDPGADARGTRMGMIVSRKVGNAVVRNRVKRHLREAYRHLRPELQTMAALRACDVVGVARAAAAAASSEQVATALQHGLKRLKRQLEAQ